MDNDKALQYLGSFLGKRLRLHTTDIRMFVGEFKCTDRDRNIILAQTYEYRPPRSGAVEAASAVSEASASTPTLKLDMTSRFLGLVVVPGQHITAIEVEEF